MGIVQASFALNKEAIEFIDSQKWELRESRSELMRRLLMYFKENPKEFIKIVKGEENNNNKK